MQIKQHPPRRFHDIMQRPRIPPIIPLRAQVQRVERGRDISDDPENQPHGRPRLSNDHGDVFARDSQSHHAHEVDHPIHHKRTFAVRVWVRGNGRVRGVVIGKRDLKSEGDQAVGEGHEEVGEHGADPADDDEFPELDGRVSFRGDEFAVDGQVEGEAEEGEDDEVDQADRDGRGGDGRVEGAQAVHGEADGGGEGLRRSLQVGDGDGGVLQDHARPHLPDHGGDFGFEGAELR